jgi:hypothetical protein
VVLSSSRRNDDNRRGGGYYSGGGGGGVYFGGFPDLWLYSRPNYARSIRDDRELSLPEAIFSFVFGDGDPNQDYEEGRWRALGQYIQRRNGVVTAEEMAPFLDPPVPDAASVSGSSGIETDDSFVLPALVKFGGEPFVDDAGHLLYRFPSFQRTVIQRVRAQAGRQAVGGFAGSFSQERQ